ncbi:exopolysaccharide biosynthesis protein [Minwuia sp.]|uniref:exopolysaccharide biosynthesis protein n=1 Tax=Minwuia sp. TaxID=2493630 RepID=UPI003A8E624E
MTGHTQEAGVDGLPGRTAAEAEQERAEEPLTEILDQLEAECDDREKLSLGEVLRGFDRRGFAPMLLVPALIALGPTGMIPGMSIATGTVILLISLQILAGRRSPWLPERAKNFRLSTRKLKSLVDRSRTTARFLDRHLRERWPFFTRGIAARLGSLFCIVMALTMFPLALVPFGVALPAAAVSLFSMGLASRDGILVLISNALGLGAIGLAVWFLATFV